MNPATIIDLSHPLLEPVPCYPGDPEFKMSLACSFPLIAAPGTINSDSDLSEANIVVRVHALSLGTHTGTHIDAPFHFFPSGQKLHEIPLAQFVGRAAILDVRHLARDRGKISWADVTSGGRDATASALSRIGSRTNGKADIVLFWTGWDVHWGTPVYFSHPYFVRDVATALYDLGAKIVGVDVLSPDETPADENAETEHGVGDASDAAWSWGAHLREPEGAWRIGWCRGWWGRGDVGRFGAAECTQRGRRSCASIWLETTPRGTLIRTLGGSREENQ